MFRKVKSVVFLKIIVSFALTRPFGKVITLKCSKHLIVKLGKWIRGEMPRCLENDDLENDSFFTFSPVMDAI